MYQTVIGGASERELLPKINFPDVLILQYVVRRARSDKASITQYIGSFADSEGLPHIMVGNQHADIPLSHKIV